MSIFRNLRALTRVASEYVHEPQDPEVMGFSWPSDSSELEEMGR